MDHSQVIEKAKAAEAYVTETFPFFKEYRACQQKAVAKASAALVTVGSGVYILQELFKRKLPYERTAFLVLPILLGTVAAYSVTMYESKICQHMWMALEEKHSALTPVQERKKEIAEAEY